MAAGFLQRTLWNGYWAVSVYLILDIDGDGALFFSPTASKPHLDMDCRRKLQSIHSLY